MPRLTAVTVNSQTRPISAATTTLKLPPSAQDLTLHLSTFTPLHSQNIRFAFRHAGRHEEWNVLPQGQNSIHLSQLSKGDNSLEIKSTDANGHWNETQSQVLHIYRAPWWYETYAAYFLYVLGAVAVLFHIHSPCTETPTSQKPTGSPETNGRDEIPVLHQYQPRTTHATDTHHRAIGILTEKEERIPTPENN